MVVTVHFHTVLQRRGPDGRISQLDLKIKPGSLVGDVLQLLEIDQPADSLILVLNGKVVEVTHSLTGGDVLHLIPAMSGGRSGFRLYPPRADRQRNDYFKRSI